MDPKEDVKAFRQEMRMMFFQEPAPKKPSSRLTKEILGMLAIGLEQVSEDVSEEQRGNVAEAFESGDYQRTIDLIVKIRDAVGRDKTAILRRAAGYIDTKYFGGSTFY